MTVKTLDSSQARNHWRDVLELALTAGTVLKIVQSPGSRVPCRLFPSLCVGTLSGRSASCFH